MVVNDEELFYQHETYIKKADNLLIKKMTGIFSLCKNSFKETKKKMISINKLSYYNDG